MQFTYRNPARSTDPSRTLAGGGVAGGRGPALRPGDSGRRAGRRAPARPRGPLRHDRPLRRAAAVARRRWPIACGPTAGRPGSCSTTTRWSTGPRPTGPGIGWFGKNANVLAPGIGSWVVLGSVLTDAPLPAADGAGGRRLRLVPSLPRRLPDRGHRRRPAWSTPAGAWPGWCRPTASSRPSTGWRSATASTAATTARRSARRRAPRARRPVDRADRRADDRPTPGPWVDVLDLLASDDAALLDRYGRLYMPHREPRYLRRNALVVLGNAGRPRRSRRGRRPMSRGDRSARWPTTIRSCGPTRSGPRAGSTSTLPADLADRLAADRRPDGAGRARPRRRGRWWRTGDPPPARHQRLPAQDRRHPVVPLGAVAPAAAGVDHGAHHPARRVRGVGRGPAVPRRAHAASGCCCRRRRSAAASTGWPPRSTPGSCCSTRPCRSGCSARRSSGPTGSSCTAPR